jgi:hypothetical protein
MSFRYIARVALLVFAGACASDVLAPVPAKVVDGVVVAVTVPGPCAFADCDPLDRPPFTLGLGTIVNTSGHTAYLHACGGFRVLISLEEQELVNGTWSSVPPFVLCTTGVQSVAMAPGDSMQFNQFFAPGIRRIVIGVATSADLTDEALASSASFSVAAR